MRDSGFGISRRMANRLLLGVAVVYMLANAVVAVVVALWGIDGEEPMPYVVAHGLGFLAGVWLTWYIARESRKRMNEDCE